MSGYRSNTTLGAHMKKVAIYIAVLTSIATMFIGCASTEVRAVRRGDLEAVTKYLSEGGDPNAMDASGQGLLHNSVQYEQYQTMLLLLDYGAQIDLQNSDGATAFLLAAGKGRLDMAQALADRGANTQSLDNAAQNAVFYGARSGNVSMLDYLFGIGLSSRNLDTDGQNPLHLLTSNQQRAIAQRLLESGADLYAAKYSSGDTPLHIAAQAGADELSQLYIATEGSALLSIVNKSGNTPLNSAVASSSVADESGLRTLEVLLSSGSDPNAAGDEGIVPIIRASANLPSTHVDVLLQYGADANTVDGNGQTPLFFAVQKQDPAMVQVLLQYQANPNVYDSFGMTPYTIALQNSAAMPVGISPSAELLGSRSAALSTNPAVLNGILNAAVENGNIQVAELILSRGAQVDVRNQQGQTALMIATSTNKSDMARLLLRYGARINEVDSQGNSPLLYAVQGADIELVRFFLQSGANAAQLNYSGNGALHLAAQSGDPEIVRLLLLSGVNPNGQNASGQTPWNLSEQNPRAGEIQQILQLAGVQPPVQQPNGQNSNPNQQQSGSAQHNSDTTNFVTMRIGQPQPISQSGRATNFEGYRVQVPAQFPEALRSKPGSTASRCTVINQSSQAVELFLIGINGVPEPRYRIEPGQQVNIEANVGSLIAVYRADGQYFGQIAMSEQSQNGYLLTD